MNRQIQSDGDDLQMTAGTGLSFEVQGQDVIAKIGSDAYNIGSLNDEEDLLNSPNSNQEFSFQRDTTPESPNVGIPETVRDLDSPEPEELLFNSPKNNNLDRPRTGGSRRLWEFILDLLKSSEFNPSHIKWINQSEGEFKIVKTTDIATMWGKIKNNEGMTYEKMSRAMRYYYRRQIMAPVLNRRLVYKFGPKSYGWSP